ncbi:dynein regulatory complex protein 10 [Aulostomus maculatus]
MSIEFTPVLTDQASPQGFSLLQKSQLEDAEKTCEVFRKKLLSFEVQLISSILDNCISQIEIAASLPAARHLDSVSADVSKELIGALRVHQRLGEKLETLEGLEQESNEAQVGEARRRALLERDFKDSVRDLLRLLRTNPDAILGLRRKLGVIVGESECTLIKGLKKFHWHMIEKLQTSPDEELQLVFFKKPTSTPAHDKVLTVKLEEAAATIKQRDAEISEKNEEIKFLESSLQGDDAKESDWLFLAEKQCQSFINMSQMKQAGIQQQVDLQNIQLNNLILENRQIERALQEKNEKVETEIKHLIQSFDDEIEATQADLELTNMDIEREVGELRKLEEPYAALEKECNQIWEKRRLAEERRNEEMRELELKTKAAVLAQAWWRGYTTRKALKSKAKGKKAKKGKGKLKK